MKISLAIHFPLCLSRYFLRIFLDMMNFSAFSTLATLVSKNTFKMSQNSSRVKKYLDKHSVKWIARLKCITARLYKYHKYINSYCHFIMYI